MQFVYSVYCPYNVFWLALYGLLVSPWNVNMEAELSVLLGYDTTGKLIKKV